jgi:hypothetical protein
MAYISDVERELRSLLRERNDYKVITFVKEKVLESYRNGLSLQEKAGADTLRKAKIASKRK